MILYFPETNSCFLTMKRKRIFYLIAFIIIIPAGLSTRKYGYLMPGFIATYGGDVLYATMFYIIYAFFFRQLQF